jgi:hypothetical protein
MQSSLRTLAIALVMLAAACGERTRREEPPARPSILLVTLDTTRADAIGPEAKGIETPSFNALAARGRRFRQAYAAVPETLPSHASMMTGLYPAGHALHENGRIFAMQAPVLAERLRQAGYHTAAFVSSFVLARRFGLARGFDVYDEPAGDERTARETTDRALAQPDAPGPRFVWVHYFDPHAPYAPPEPFRTRFAAQPYLGEVAAMDEQLGRLVAAFERGGPAAIVVVADHGEGLGDHGELQHGSLLYQATMHVPLAIAGPGVPPGVVDTPVSTRHVFHTVLDFAGLGADDSLRAPKDEVVLGEAMKPFLSYGWRPQVMAVEGRVKTIQAGRLEAYDVAQDPLEAHDLGEAGASRAVRNALREYPTPSIGPAAPPAATSDEDRRRLASLGYVAAGAAPVVRTDAPRPADMVRLFEPLERASALFVREEYAQAIPLLERILREDPHNLDATLRLATAHSALGHGHRRSRRSPARASWRPTHRTSARIGRSTTRGARDGSRPSRRWSRPSASRPIACPCWRRWPRSASGRAVPPTRSSCDSASRGCARRRRTSWFDWGSSRWPRSRPTPPSRPSSRRARRGPRPSRTTSSWACSTWPPAASPRRETPWTACRRRTPNTRWRCSSGPRSASCSTSPIAPRASTPRGGAPTPPRAT